MRTLYVVGALVALLALSGNALAYQKVEYHAIEEPGEVPIPFVWPPCLGLSLSASNKTSASASTERAVVVLDAQGAGQHAIVTAGCAPPPVDREQGCLKVASRAPSGTADAGAAQEGNKTIVQGGASGVGAQVESTCRVPTCTCGGGLRDKLLERPPYVMHGSHRV